MQGEREKKHTAGEKVYPVVPRRDRNRNSRVLPTLLIIIVGADKIGTGTTRVTNLVHVRPCVLDGRTGGEKPIFQPAEANA